MFPLSKQRSEKRLKAAIDRGPEVMLAYLEKWNYFRKTLVFKEDVPLAEIAFSFCYPLMEFTRREYPVLTKVPGNIFVLYLFSAIESSRSHTEVEVAEAKKRFESEFAPKLFPSHLPG